MLLTIDVGNTHIVVGAFSDDKIVFVSRIKTDDQKTADEYAVIINSIVSLHNFKSECVKGAALSCVVPQLTGIIKDAIKLCFGVNTLTVGPGIKTGIKLNCDSPAQVGADLICACVAAHELYGEPTVILDMGTATKLLFVDSDGTFSGASIAPGIRMGADALVSGTAQLPQISLEAPQSVLGKNTIDCMKSGVVLGGASMIDGMIMRTDEELGKPCRIVATGGLAGVIVPHCRSEIEIDSALILKGLRFLYEKNKRA